MCSTFAKKIRIHLYHSLGKTYRMELCGDEEYLDAKHDIAIVYTNIQYVMCIYLYTICYVSL